MTNARVTLMALVIVLATAGDAAGKMRIYYNKPFTSFTDRLKTNAAHHPWKLGYLDVTQPPYNAKGDGVTDDTAAIKMAIEDGFDNNLVVYFPLGTYLVSQQLKMTDYKLPTSAADRKYIHALMGQRSSSGARPTIKLKDGASVAQNLLIDFEYVDGGKEVAMSHYNSHLRGIDIDMGNNPSTSALGMDGAQYCVIEDVTITGTFDVGIKGLPGSGGSTTNVRIEGGKVGVLQNLYRPSPSLHGLVLKGQSQAGIKLLNTRGPLVVVGFHIESPAAPAASWRAIHASNASAAPIAEVVLVDGTILDHGAQVAIYNQYQDLYIRNVYVKAATILQSGGAPEVIKGSAGGWTRLAEYFFASAKNKSTAVVDGKELGKSSLDKVIIEETEPVAGEPPSNLVSMHTWDEASYPDCVQQSCILVTDHGATPDDLSDDDAPAMISALKAALSGPDKGKPVFLPRGVYHIGQTVHVPSGVRLVGPANAYSVLRMSTGWKPTAPTHALLTEDTAQGALLLGDFTVLGRQKSGANGLASHKYISLLGLRSHATLVRDVMLAVEDQADQEGLKSWRKDCHYHAPMAILSGNLSGKIYNLAQDMGTAHEQGGSLDPGYRTLLLDGVVGPLEMYQPDVEYGDMDPQAEIVNSTNVFWYAFKFEKEHMLLRIKGSSNVAVLGGSGNYTLCGGDDRIIDVQSSKDLLLTNLGRQNNGCGGASETPVYHWVVHGSVTAASTANLGIFKQGTPSFPATNTLGSSGPPPGPPADAGSAGAIDGGLGPGTEAGPGSSSGPDGGAGAGADPARPRGIDGGGALLPAAGPVDAGLAVMLAVMLLWCRRLRSLDPQ
jgi:hypothetical protein